MSARIPLLMMICQEEVPRDFRDVAVLLRFPSMETPRMIMRVPRVTKPEEGERSGQLVAM